MKKQSITKFLKSPFPGISPRSFTVSLLHSIWLVAACLLWLGYINLMDGFGFMNDYMNIRTFINEYILRRQPEPDLSDTFLLINTSQNNALLPLDNDNTINTIITDRELLTRKLEMLDSNSDKISFIICDIYFESLSDNQQADSALQAVIMRLSDKNKFVMPGYFNHKTRQFQPPVFRGTSGVSQYRSSFLNTQFLKYTYITNGYKQMPLIAYESVYDKSLEKKRILSLPVYTMGRALALNTIIPEFRYTNSDLKDGFNYYQLGMFDELFIGNKQIVIIGDFEGRNDLHYSMAGLSAGPMVLLNACLALVHGDNLISIWYILLLLVVFFWISFQHFYNKLELPEAKTRWKKILKYLAEQRIYFVMLGLVYISMLFFHHYIHLLILLSYFALLGFVRDLVIKE